MKIVWLSLFLTLLASAYADRLVVTVTDDGVSVPLRFESGYTEFVLDNQSSNVYAHEIVRVKDGADPELFKQGIIAFFSGRADETTIGNIIETMDVFVGGAIGTMPGNTRSVGLTLTPGTYVMYADQISEEGLIIDETHTAFITVTEAANPAPEPTADYTIKMAEYAFALPGDIKAGTHLVKFENIGKEDHLGFVFKLPDGMTPEEAMHSEAPNVDWGEAQGVHAVGGGSATYVEMTFEPGATYLFDCPIPNDEGVSHDELGMMQFLTIAE
jgi:uncharacterized cupredoxin-like copper-binding protein